jgi:predicted site-specific integrase-resolvase
MKLSKWAKENGISYITAYRWAKSGKIPGCKIMDSGTILVKDTDDSINIKNNIFIYARVSSNKRRNELDYQVNRIMKFANSNGFNVDKVFKEVASGMNDNRTQFWKMMDSNPSVIIIENKDRLTRFGFNYIERLSEKLNTKIIVMNENQTDEQDLMKDLVSIVTSFCCRLYGLRRGYNNAKKIQKQIHDNSKKEA